MKNIVAFLTREQILEKYKNTKNYKEEKYKGYLLITFITEKNQPALIVFKGKQSKPISRIAYFNEENRTAAINKIKQVADKEYQHIEERRLEKKDFRHTLLPGDILYSSGGYDQTNIYYYVVNKVLTEKSVEIQRIGSKIIGSKNHEDLVIPDKTRTLGSPMRKVVKQGYYKGVDAVKIDSYETAYKWDGEPKGQTPFGFGH